MTTHTSGTADLPEALRIAAALEYCDASVAREAINELRRLAALTAQAISQLGGFDAGDMASAAAGGYRDGWAAAQAGGGSAVAGDDAIRRVIGPLLNEFGERQWQSGAGVAHKSLEDVFEAVIEAVESFAKATPTPLPDAPLSVFSKGPWGFKETGQDFSGAELDEAAFVAYRERASHGQAPAWATKPTEQQILEAAFAPAQPAAEASRFGSPELQAMIVARCVEKDQADSVQDEALIRQMLEALETCNDGDGYNGPYQYYETVPVEEAVAAARARLLGKPTEPPKEQT